MNHILLLNVQRMHPEEEEKTGKDQERRKKII
jgi:hypothetical protein